MNDIGVDYIEIGPKINPKIAVFPEDTPFSSKNLLHFNNGHNLILNGIETTVHLGAHTDAPNHYDPTGAGIDERNPFIYMGKCQVIEVIGKKAKERIVLEDLEGHEISAPRVIFKTSSFTDPYNWTNDFNSLSPEVIKYLAGKEVVLVGIDTPSVDPAEDKDLESHNEIAKNDMAILEGVVLEQVKPGTYYLLAVPLMLEGLDASPVRPMLFTEDNWKKLLTI